MHTPHPSFCPPADENATIWRYVDFSKLVSMLDAKSLHFTRLDGFDDRFEGAVPKPVADHFRVLYDAMEKTRPDEWALMREKGLPPTALFQLMRSKSVVNCWHLNEYESTAMWAQYLKSASGVAIQSTYRRLLDSFNGEDRDLHVFVGKVRYIDYSKDFIEYNNSLIAATHKRASFSHEAELRALAVGGNSASESFAIDLREFPKQGIDVPVALDILVKAIYVAPGSPRWFRLAVESVTAKYDLNVPVLQSSLDDEPLW